MVRGIKSSSSGGGVFRGIKSSSSSRRRTELLILHPFQNWRREEFYSTGEGQLGLEGKVLGLRVKGLRVTG